MRRLHISTDCVYLQTLQKIRCDYSDLGFLKQKTELQNDAEIDNSVALNLLND